MTAVWVFIEAVNAHLLVLKRVLTEQEPVKADALHTSRTAKLSSTFPVLSRRRRRPAGPPIGVLFMRVLLRRH